MTLARIALLCEQFGLEGGTAGTAYFCMKKGKPYKLIDGEEISVERAVVLLSDFIEEKAIRVLNVAGPRASRNPLAYGYTRAVVEGVLRGSGR